MKIGKSKIVVMITILKICEKHHKTYCWPTRKKIQDIMKKIHKIDISLRAIDYHLQHLRDLKYIKSFKRSGTRPNGTHYNLPSNRQLTKKGVYFLLSLCVKVSDWIKAWIESGICPKYAQRHQNSSRPQSNYIPKRILTVPI